MSNPYSSIGIWLSATGVALLISMALVILLSAGFVAIREIASKGIRNLGMNDIGALLTIIAFILMIAGLAIAVIAG